jgi:hypothetical protein
MSVDPTSDIVANSWESYALFFFTGLSAILAAGQFLRGNKIKVLHANNIVGGWLVGHWGFYSVGWLLFVVTGALGTWWARAQSLSSGPGDGWPLAVYILYFVIVGFAALWALLYSRHVHTVSAFVMLAMVAISAVMVGGGFVITWEIGLIYLFPMLWLLILVVFDMHLLRNTFNLNWSALGMNVAVHAGAEPRHHHH